MLAFTLLFAATLPLAPVVTLDEAGGCSASSGGVSGAELPACDIICKSWDGTETCCCNAPEKCVSGPTTCGCF